MTIQLKQAAEQLRQSASERIDCGNPVTVPEMEPGDMWAQGDVGVLRIEKLPDSSVGIGRPKDGQIAPGNTRGSRHCVDDLNGIRYYRHEGDPLSDLSIVAPVVWRLRHPEHADCTFAPGIYQFVHEQNEQRQRVTD